VSWNEHAASFTKQHFKFKNIISALERCNAAAPVRYTASVHKQLKYLATN
jgi:hypothetical protein